MNELEILLTNMQEATLEAIITKKQVNMIIDYINKLSKENKELKEQLENKIDLYEDTISYQLGFDKGKEYLQQRIDKTTKDLQELIDKVNNKTIIGLNEFIPRLEVIQDELAGDKE